MNWTEVAMEIMNCDEHIANLIIETASPWPNATDAEMIDHFEECDRQFDGPSSPFMVWGAE